MKKKLLEAIENNAHIRDEDLAAMLGVSTEDVRTEIDELERKNIICGYHTFINWDKVGEEKADALIEVKVTPQRGVGFDQMAERIYQYPEVSSIYLISGNCDFMVQINGRTMRDIAMFVTGKLSTIEGVLSTTTQFILKKYKQEGIIFESSRKDERVEMA